jgi:hypothetical protein
MRNPLVPLFLLVAMLFTPACPGCPGPVEVVSARVVDCSSQTWDAKSFKVMERVNLILTTSGEWDLLRSVAITQVKELVKEFGWDLVACVLGLKRDQALAGAHANPDDKLSAEMAFRASDLMRELDVHVKGAPPAPGN